MPHVNQNECYPGRYYRGFTPYLLYYLVTYSLHNIVCTNVRNSKEEGPPSLTKPSHYEGKHDTRKYLKDETNAFLAPFVRRHYSSEIELPTQRFDSITSLSRTIL